MKSFKLSLESLRNDRDSLKYIYNTTLDMCAENVISIFDIKRKQVSSETDSYAAQYFILTKEN